MTEGPAWARGYPPAALHNIATFFKAHEGQYVRSQHAHFNEAAAATALAVGAYRPAYDPTGALAAAVVLHTAKVRTPWRDFRGTSVATINRGEAVARRIAGRPQPLRSLLVKLAPQWVECWPERQADVAALEALGYTWAGSKVTAAGEIRALYGTEARPPALGVDAYGLAPVALEYDRAAIAHELTAVAPPFAHHYSQYNRRRSWTAVALRGYSDDPSFIVKPAEMAQGWQRAHPEATGWALRDTPLMAAFPTVAKLLARLPTDAHRVRFMALAPKRGELARHADTTDRDAGSYDGQLMRVHLPILTNPGVTFEAWLPTGGHQVQHMAAGSAWWLDTRKPHRATNTGTATRYHLVLDLVANPALRALVCAPPPCGGASAV